MYLYQKRGTAVVPADTADSASDKTLVECGHVCNAIPIMIGSRLERKVIARMVEMLGVRISDVYDQEYLHTIYAGSFLVNGTFYYSVFRESNNNKICHNSKSKYRGDETVAYFYDNTCNRGVKLFTDRSGQLKVNDRDGNEVTEVTPDVMSQLYKECTPNWHLYTLDMRLVTGFFAAVKRQGLTGIDNFKNKIYTNYSIGLNTFLDKLPSTAMCNSVWNTSLMVGKINLGISQRLSYSKTKSETKKQNEQKLKMCTGGMSTGYLVETQRRRNTRKANTTTPMTPNNETTNETRDGCGEKRKRQASRPRHVKKPRTDGTVIGDGDFVGLQDTDPVSGPTILGSKVVKTVGLIEKLEQGERNGPSTFNQVSVSYLPLIRVLSNTVQKLQVEHVHAESSKTVPRDASGFICMKYMGNISTAGKNMLFTQRVHVSYGHVHKVVAAVERGIERLESQATTEVKRLVVSRNPYDVCASNHGEWLHVVINNAVTSWTILRKQLWAFLVHLKTRCHRYAWMKTVGDYACIYFYEGVPMLRYERGETFFATLRDLIGKTGEAVLTDVQCLYFTRDELEMLATEHLANTGRTSEPRTTICGGEDLINATNTLIDRWFARIDSDVGHERDDNSSLLAKHVDQFSDYTAPAKRSVSVNARKSACINVYYQRAAELIRGFNIFTDPDGYERATAERVASEHGVPEWVTLRDFIRTRAETENCPQPQDGTDRSVSNFYMFRTIFADVSGYNVEDANVLDASLNLSLSYSYSFSLTFVDRSRSGLDIIVPPPRNAAAVCCWDAYGNPTTVMFTVCTIRKKDGDDLSEAELNGMLRMSPDVRIVGMDGNGDATHTTSDKCATEEQQQQLTASRGDTISFPPFRKLSVIRSKDGNYHVYFMRNDAVLLRSLYELRAKSGLGRKVPDMSNAARLSENEFAFICEPEVNPYDALTYLKTNVTTFHTDADERIVTVDVRVRGKSDKYDGIKVVNSFGQKGLASFRDLSPYFRQQSPASSNVPVQLVMNNCSFVSRQPIGQYLQMKKNMFAVTTSTAGEETSVGYTAVFFTETEPVTKSCLVRFDEMMRSVIITLGLTVFQNVKNSMDNVYNPHGVLYPPQTRQILSLYRCMGVSYKFSGDKTTAFATRDEVMDLMRIYDTYNGTPKPTKVNGTKVLMDILNVLREEHGVRRLSDTGILAVTSDRRKDDHNHLTARTRTYTLRLHGQWLQKAGDETLAADCTATRRPDYELRTYRHKNDAYTTVYVFGDLSLFPTML